jgi:DNA-binding NtrC family response regulator
VFAVKNTILVVSDNPEERLKLENQLVSEGYDAFLLDSLAAMEIQLKEKKYMAVIIDIDSIEVDNRTIRQLTLRYPETPLLCASFDKFHPELKDAICYHIYACLNKPIDPDELFYWLKCIQRDETESRAPPATDP